RSSAPTIEGATAAAVRTSARERARTNPGVNQVEKYSGKLTEVGPLHNRDIALIRIGSTTLRKVRCMPEIGQMLLPDREMTLYIYRHMFYKPVILGLKYADTGAKQLLSPATVRGSLIQIVILLGLGFIVGALIVGGMIVGMLGMNPETFGGVFALIGFGAAIYLAVRFWLDMQAAQAD